MTVHEDLTHELRVDDPHFYVDDPYPAIARVLSEAPVLLYPEFNTWLVSKYHDVRAVSSNWETFSVVDGILLNDAKFGNVANSFFPEGAELISTTDPPRHRDLRRVIAPVFTPRFLASLEGSIREYTSAMFDKLDSAATIDGVDDLAVALPIFTVARMLGLPTDDLGNFRYWTDEMVKMGAPLSPEELAQAAANTAPCGEYLFAQLERKRSEPGDDLISTLLKSELDGRNITDLNILMLCTAVLVAGNGTTRNLMSGMMWLLSQHPEQFAKVKADPSLAANVVEESLRHFTPVPGFLRTATRDTELRGVTIGKGQHVYVFYMAANRDEDVFPDPDVFDVARPIDPGHLAFGFGQHVCVGASLARLEARIFVEELTKRFSSIELAGTPQRTLSILENGFQHLPLRFVA